MCNAGNRMVFKNLQYQNDYYCKHITGYVSLSHQNFTKIFTWAYLSVAGFFLWFIPTTFPTVFRWGWVDAISQSFTRTVHSTSRITFTPRFPCSPSYKDKVISEAYKKLCKTLDRLKNRPVPRPWTWDNRPPKNGAVRKTGPEGLKYYWLD